MDPLSKLPIECLQLILQVLAQERRNATLATLLQTNKHIATVTLPFLYDNPYRKGLHGYMTVQTTRSRIRSDHVLTRILLSHLPLETLPPVLSQLLVGTTNSPKPLDYAAFIRHLCLPSWALDLDYYWPKGHQRREGLAHIQGPEFTRMCQAHNLLPCYEENLGTDLEIQGYHYQVIVWREACWSLASPILDQLQSLTIPIFDLDRYASVITRLGNLEHLEFALDDIVDYSEEAYYGGDMVMSPAFESEAKTRKERRLQAMVQLVRDHAQLFPGLLKTVICIDAEMWPDLSQTCPVETKLEIFRILPPLKSPTFLSKTNFLHFTAHLQSTDLRQVQEITDLESPPCLWYDLRRDGREFLQRCRALKSIHMDTLGPGSFAWAVQEKRAMESFGTNNANNNNESTYGVSGGGREEGRGGGASSLQESRPAYLEYGLVPLEEFNISESDEPLTDEDDNVVIAFSQTLKKITITAATYEQLHIPRTLHIVALKKLWIAIGRDDVDAYFIPPRSELEQSFDENFAAGVEERYGEGLESTQEIQAPGMSRPKWTWDWYLPQLTSLTLTAEFAYRFQFRMLQGCPSLEFLNLNMRLTDVSDQFTRVLTKADFFMPSGITDSLAGEGEQLSSKEQQQEVAIVAPSLEVVRLVGPWVIDDDLVPQFFIHMLPSLEDLEEEGLRGYTLERLVEVLKSMPNKVEEMHLSLPEPTEESAKEMGLIGEKDDDDNDGDGDDGEDGEGGRVNEEGPGVNLYLEWNRYFLKQEFEAGV
ncbi:hypothetical protein BGZ97_011734 [Linnemannia gamsii]|uniref:Uncharacterized protein n=1 Tax=Linnemannia gamsii TaxID=64522 RepID=A0A9P6R7V7_9FUNG|nr:hypothetical protein BGZ97_011734 [Linnemannia gamsii]